MPVFANSISSLGLGPTGSCHKFLEMGAWGKQKFGSRFFIFALGVKKTWSKVGDPEWGCKNIWLKKADLAKTEATKGLFEPLLVRA